MGCGCKKSPQELAQRAAALEARKKASAEAKAKKRAILEASTRGELRVHRLVK